MMNAFAYSHLALLCFVSFNLFSCDAFTPPSKVPTTTITSKVPSTTALNGLFGSDGAIGGLFGQKDNGPKQVIDIPAKDVKVGALRFLLQIHLVGESNKPEPKSWLVSQGNEGDLQVYYKDGTGMLSIDLQDYGIKAYRYGEKPSLQYVLQESVLLHSILDELNNVAFEVEDIDLEKRLLKLKEDDIIEKARETLPARAEA